MTWRYQAVYTFDKEGDRHYTICEVYLNSEGKLENWTATEAMAPSGDSVDDLLWTVRQMLKDAKRWPAVPFDALKVGMKFDGSD